MVDLSEDGKSLAAPGVKKEETVLKHSFIGISTFEDLKLCVIPVCIEGDKNKQIFDLLVDTGAEITVLAQPVANIVGIEPQGSISAQGAGVSKFKQGIVRNLEIGYGTTSTISLGACRVAIGQFPNKFSEYSILGVLGAEAIQELCIKINYPSKYLELSNFLG